MVYSESLKEKYLYEIFLDNKSKYFIRVSIYLMGVCSLDKGWIDRKAVVLESLRSIHRAGADVILTYYGTEAAGWLREQDA